MEDVMLKKRKKKKRIWVKPIKKILTKLKLIAVLKKTLVLKCLNFLKFCFIFKLTKTNDSYYKELPA